jgi:hypothetical protein
MLSGLTIGGKRDWRLPSKIELAELAKYGAEKGENPAEYFNSIGFTNVVADWYWASGPGNDSIYMGGVGGYDLSGVYFVWPVRSGQ